jgi:cytochrome c556
MNMFIQQGARSMKNYLSLAALILLVCSSSASMAEDDARQLVQLPEMMQQHMMSNMRDHLAVINELLINIANDELDEAARIAEYRLGMSALESHGASHMARFMPEGMRQAGTDMHRAASRFALKAQEGDVLPAYAALSEITSACVACHSGYRIR